MCVKKVFGFVIHNIQFGTQTQTLYFVFLYSVVLKVIAALKVFISYIKQNIKVNKMQCLIISFKLKSKTSLILNMLYLATHSSTFNTITFLLI